MCQRNTQGHTKYADLKSIAFGSRYLLPFSLPKGVGLSSRTILTATTEMKIFDSMGSCSLKVISILSGVLTNSSCCGVIPALPLIV